MMSRREALLLVDRLKRRTRDPEVLTLCDYVNGMEVHGTIPAFRQPGDGTPPAVFPTASCPVRGTSGGRDGEEKKMAPWAPRLKTNGFLGPLEVVAVIFCAPLGSLGNSGTNSRLRSY